MGRRVTANRRRLRATRQRRMAECLFTKHRRQVATGPVTSLRWVGGCSPNTPTTGLRERGNDTSRSTGRSGRQNAATRRNMRREERVTVQGPVKEQQPDGMSHRGCGMVCGLPSLMPLPLCMAHRCVNAAFSLPCAPVARRDAHGRGSARCIAQHQNQLILTTCHVRYCIILWDSRSIRQL